MRGQREARAPQTTQDTLRGTLDMLVLRVVARGDQHGWGISEAIGDRSREVLQVGQGALYPALHRLERRGFLRSYWGRSENNRRAKYYAITQDGHEHLAAEERGWERFTEAVNRVLAPGGGGVSA